MKLSVVAFLLLGISMIVLSIHDTYAHAEEDDKNKDYRVYQNDAIGISLEYPNDWNLMESSRPDLPFVARIWAPGNTGLISIDHVYRDTKISPEEIAESQVKMLETKENDLRIIESKSLLVSDDYPAWQLAYSTSDNAANRLIESHVYVADDNSRYVFTYERWESFPDNLSVFDDVIVSVQIIPIDMKNTSKDFSESVTATQTLPDWFEYNARWWNTGQIDDQTMISAIEFLADHNIITMPSEKEIDLYRISQSHYADLEHYDMIKHSAWYWAESDLGAEYLLKGIGYLASLDTQDKVSNDPKNPEDCPLSFSSRCITGTMTEIFDGNTVRVDMVLFRLALVSSPGLDEEKGQDAKEFLEMICPVGSDALVDQDDLRPLEGLSGTSRILAVVYCDGLNLNEKLVEFDFEYFDNMYCHTSEFAGDPWAKEGCSE